MSLVIKKYFFPLWHKHDNVCAICSIGVNLQAMFKRRKPLTFFETAKQFVWPSMGWSRAISYVKHRLLRISDTPHNVALGLAVGLGVSFTPLLGTHFIQAGLIALILRANPIAAMIGTFIGNPWTFPFFWWAGLSSGSFLFSFLGLKGAQYLPEDITIESIWDVLFTHPWDLLLPWMLGGYLLAIISIPASYYVYIQLIESAKKARDKARDMRKREKLKKAEKKEQSIARGDL